MKIINGKELSEKILENLKDEISQYDRKPEIVLINVEGDAASAIYINLKRKAAEKTGMISVVEILENNVSEEKLLEVIDKYNNDNNANGILVQLPLPEHINTKNILDRIKPEKDVDGFHYANIGKITQGRIPYAYPCTPLGIIKLLEEYNIEIEGKNVVIIGRSNIVGKPLGLMLLNKNATVTYAHSKTKNLKEVTQNADILISATGQPHLVTKDMVKQDAIVIDVGISKINGKLIGDIDFENVAPKTSFITPVPGGVGPMTIAMLLSNTLSLYKIQNGLSD